MLTYDFDSRGEQGLYDFLYSCIKKDILSGRLKPGTRLPSKREMALDNGVSLKTVVSAYEQLLLEGYIYAEEKRGYFVANVQTMPEYQPVRPEFKRLYKEDKYFVDFTANNTIYDNFPFATWRKVVRNVLSEYDQELIKNGSPLGIEALRNEIADYLYRARGMTVSPDCIIIGAGMDYLYNRLLHTLLNGKSFAVENPCYRKIPRIYEENNLKWTWVGLDSDGVNVSDLEASGAQVVHVSPEHHYPLGTVMTTSRRQELLKWAASEPDRYIIEDDFDCEFRYRSRSIPALQSIDRNHRVIYMNSFSKTMAPAIRISYMILPEKLMGQYLKETNFWSCSVPNLEQYVMAEFIRDGYFERHLNRMRKYYQALGERLLRIVKQNQLLPVIRATGGESGTHLLVKVDTDMNDTEIKWAAKQQGINVSCLSDFCCQPMDEYQHTLILNYSDMDENTLRAAVRKLSNIFVAW